MLYFCEISPNVLITHDGTHQLGLIHMSTINFIKSVEVEYLQVYWVPDPVGKRYKTVSYQKHLCAVSKLSTLD